MITPESIMAVGLFWVVNGIFGMTQNRGLWYTFHLVLVLIGAFMATHGLARLIERVGCVCCP